MEKIASGMIPFNRPFLTGRELSYIAEAHMNGQLAGDGIFTKRCQLWLEKTIGAKKALLTHSCTAALEMAAILCEIEPGDEVILPSYTFVSTANAFVLRGAKPVFVDIRADTLNIDETKIEAAITPKTKAIIPVHYAGVACEMDEIMEIAKRHNLFVIEDAAQGCLSKYKGRYLGTIGDIGCFSFHETKNIISGEGGAILINRREMIERAEIIREKGTDRSKFFRKEIDKYTWRDIGSSFLPGEIIAAFLWAQIESAEDILNRRLLIWNYYHRRLQEYENFFQQPKIPSEVMHNAHMYYLINLTSTDREEILNSLGNSNIKSVFHYTPLHSSAYARRFYEETPTLEVTDFTASNLFRLPLWVGLTENQQDLVIKAIEKIIRRKKIHSYSSEKVAA
jgi:dTDP-4-amino-4,6-dideoxygalactose transaminase